MPQGLTIEKVREMRPYLAQLPPDEQRAAFEYAWNILILPKLDVKHLSRTDRDASREQYVTAMMGAVPTKLPETFGRPEREMTTREKALTTWPLSSTVLPMSVGISSSIDTIHRLLSGVAPETFGPGGSVRKGFEEHPGIERSRELLEQVKEKTPGFSPLRSSFETAGELALPMALAAPVSVGAGIGARALGLGPAATAALAGGVEGAATMPLFTGEVDPTQMAVGAVAGGGLGAVGSKVGQWFKKNAAEKAARLATAPSEREALTGGQVSDLTKRAVWDKAGKRFTEASEEGKAKLNELAQKQYPGRDYPYLNKQEKKIIYDEFKGWQKATADATAAVEKDAEIVASAGRKEAARQFKKRVEEYVRVSGRTPTVGDPAYNALKAGRDVFDITGQPRPAAKVPKVKAPTSVAEQAIATEALQAEPSVAAATSGLREAREAVKPAIARSGAEKAGVRDLYQIGESEAERMLPLRQRIENALTKLAQQTRQHSEDILLSDNKNKNRALQQLNKMHAQAASLIRKGDFDLTGALPSGKEIPVSQLSEAQAKTVTQAAETKVGPVGKNVVEMDLTEQISALKELEKEYTTLGKKTVYDKIVTREGIPEEQIDYTGTIELLREKLATLKGAK
jgi:hypothetical protein